VTRGRKPKPNHLRVIEGNPGKRAINPNEPKPPISEGLTPPTHLNSDGKREWRRIARQLELLGLLSDIDRGALGAYCQSYGIEAQASRGLKAYARTPAGKKLGMLAETPSGALIQHPLVGVARRARLDMVKFAAEFGMTPSARSRVKVEPGDKGSKFAGLVGGKVRA